MGVDLNTAFIAERSFCLRALGIALIVLSGIGAALFLSHCAEERAVRVRALLELTMYVRNSVEHYSITASEIARGCDGELLRRIGYPESAERPAALCDIADRSDVPDMAARSAFLDMVRGFGREYRGRQAELCGICEQILRERAEELEAKLPSVKRTVICVCVSITLVLVILLL